MKLFNIFFFLYILINIGCVVKTPTPMDYEVLMEKEGFKVIKSKPSCITNVGSVAGYYDGRTQTVCYSNAKGDEKRTLRHEFIHFLQNEVSLKETNDFFEQSPLCEGYIPFLERQFIESYYSEEKLEKEKPAWAYSRSEECVQAAAQFFF